MATYKHEYPTEAEAKAFVDGVNCVGDIDVSTDGPKAENGNFAIYVTVGDPADGEDEGGAAVDLSEIPVESRPCILTGAEGENADDCTTHEHEQPKLAR